MDKSLVIFCGFTLATLIFIAISFAINFSFINRIKKISGLKNLIFGVQITLIGVFVFYLIFNYTIYSSFWSVVKYFIPIYILTTAFTFSLIGYLDKTNNE